MAQREEQRAEQRAATKDASRVKFVRRAVESASEYNLFLNRQRRLERSSYIDHQTDTINYPVGLGRDNKTLTSTEKIGRFPVAVMPSQYQDWYIEYTPEELQFLPVDTVLKGPIIPIEQLPPVLTTPDVSEFEDDDSNSSCSSSDGHSDCSCCADGPNAEIAPGEPEEESQSATLSPTTKRLKLESNNGLNGTRSN